MIRSRLFWEIVLPYVAFTLAVAAASAAVGGHVYGLALRDGLIGRLRTAAEIVALHDDRFTTPPAAWAEELSRTGSEVDARLTVIAGDGTVLADTEADPLALGSQSGAEDLREAASGPFGVADALPGRVRVAVAARGSTADGARSNPLGFVRAEASTGAVEAAVRRWQVWSLALAAAAAALGLAWAARIAFRLSRPVEAFTRSAFDIAGGRRAGVLPRLRPGHALAPLSAALDEMSRELSGQIDSLRRENESLREVRERLAAVLTGMAEGVLAVAADDRILLANPAAGRLLDLPDGKLTGRPLWEAVRVPAIQEAARAALAGRETAQTEVELPRTQTSLALRASRLPGEPCPGVVLVLHDISELRRLENLRRDFVSNVSHELKTPLASIQAYTETLIEGAVDDPENNQRFLRRIAEQADRLHNLILDLLRLARIEAGTDVFDIKKLTAGKIIQPCVDEHAAVARQKGVALDTQPPSEPVRLRADPEGLRTILDNLLDNAINYTPSGGRVAVRWGRENGTAVIEVSDTGIGIPEEHLPRIFERFHRVDKARSRDYGGTGLGLAIVKHLVQVFEGRVEVESAVGRGSTFRIYLPIA